MCQCRWLTKSIVVSFLFEIIMTIPNAHQFRSHNMSMSTGLQRPITFLLNNSDVLEATITSILDLLFVGKLDRLSRMRSIHLYNTLYGR
jgi:hypothetical protein